MAVTEGSDALRQVPLFAGLDDGLLGAPGAGAARGGVPRGALIFSHGDVNASLYLIRHGKVKVALMGPTEEVVLSVLGDGDFFGELSLCDGGPRSAGVAALEPTTTWVLPRAAFVRFLEAHPPAATEVLKVLACRLRDTTERFSDTVFLDISARVAKRLLQLADTAGRHTAAGIENPALADRGGNRRPGGRHPLAGGNGVPAPSPRAGSSIGTAATSWSVLPTSSPSAAAAVSAASVSATSTSRAGCWSRDTVRKSSSSNSSSAALRQRRGRGGRRPTGGGGSAAMSKA